MTEPPWELFSEPGQGESLMSVHVQMQPIFDHMLVIVSAHYVHREERSFRRETSKLEVTLPELATLNDKVGLVLEEISAHLGK